MLLLVLASTVAIPQMGVRALAALASPPVARRSPQPVLKPDADGIVDVAAALAATRSEPVPNPFRARVVGSPGTRILRLDISGVACPANDIDSRCCIIDGELRGPGETIDGFTVSEVGLDSVDLRRSGLVLRLPVDQPIVVRLPR
ncbi:MAG: hypothetical protein ACREFX_15485 [Opitutaceae bacterium]